MDHADVLKKNERMVGFYDFQIEASSRTFPAPAAIGVRKALDLMVLVPLAERNKQIRGGRATLYVSDWKKKGNVVHVLINKSDKEIADPVFSIPEQKKRRVAEKLVQEGQDFSVHICIELPEKEGDAALMLLEH